MTDSHRHGNLRLLLTAALLALPFQKSIAASGDRDAKEIVERRVEAAGYILGYDEDTDRLIRVGTSIKRTPAPASMDPAILSKKQADLFRIALLDAKFKTMQSIFAAFDASVISRFESEGEVSSSVAKSAIGIRSHLVLHGFHVLDTAESWEDGWYELAVAVGWSPEWESRACTALSGDLSDTGEIPSPEWRKWAETQDFSKLVGAVTFEDSEGRLRFVGIGLSDIEGKSGAALLAAMRLARMKATEMLAYLVLSDLDGREVIEQIQVSGEKSDGSSWTEIIEPMANRFEQRIRHERFKDSEVYTTTVVHPITGRKLFVSVAGIEPRDLAEMNLLGNAARSGGGSRPGEPPARPDHFARPAHPNRPDHSARPASNRPEHPSRRRLAEDDGDDGSDMDF